MALTQISTKGIKDGTITGSDLATNVDLVDNQKLRLGTGNDLQIYHNGIQSFIDNSTGRLKVRSNTIKVTNLAEDHTYILCNEAGTAHEVQLYYDDSKKFFTISNGVQATNRIIVGEGTAQRGLISGDANGVSVGAISNIPVTFVSNSTAKCRINGNDFQILNDSGKLQLGAAQDLQIFHNGSNSKIDNSTGTLYIQGDAITLTGQGGSENLAVFTKNGSVELNYDNSKKFETTSNGADVTGRLTTDGVFIGDGGNNDVSLSIGANNDLRLYHDGSNSYIRDRGTGNLIISGNQVSIESSDLAEFMVKAIENAQVELYYNGSKKFKTTSAGVDVTGSLSVANHITLPDQASGVGKIKMGDGVDFQIYHNGTHSVIENRTGSLLFYNNTNELAARFVPNGAVDLYYDNSKKFETTSTGVTVTGQINQTSAGAQNVHKFGSPSPFLYGQFNSSGDASINNQASANLLFGTANTTRMTIDSAGRVLIGATTEGNESADELTINSSGNTGITLRSGTSANTSLFFSDATSGAAEYVGFVQYQHATDDLKLGTSSSTRMTINSSGSVGIGLTNPTGKLAVSDGTVVAEINPFSASSGAFIGTRSNHHILFKTNATERARITTDGNTVFTDKDSGHRGGGFYSRTKTVSLSGDNRSSFMRFTVTHGALAGMIYLTGSNNGASVARVYSFVTSYNNTVNTNPISDTGSFSGKHFSFTSSTSNNVHTFMVQVSGATQEVNMTVHLGNANQDVTYTEL